LPPPTAKWWVKRRVRPVFAREVAVLSRKRSRERLLEVLARTAALVKVFRSRCRYSVKVTPKGAVELVLRGGEWEWGGSPNRVRYIREVAPRRVRPRPCFGSPDWRSAHAAVLPPWPGWAERQLASVGRWSA